MRDTSLSWQKKLAQGFTSVTELLTYLELPLSTGNLDAEKQFPSRIPLGFAKRMQKGNPHDPLLLQVLASGYELQGSEEYSSDPLDEHSNNSVRGLLHKYHGRVLLTMTGVCAVNCRYCFRRHFPYQANNPGRAGLKHICDYIAQDTSITEVILSGGDPLLASDVVLGELIEQLEQIPHLHTLRIHTRIPVVFPERIDLNLLSLLKKVKLNKVIVLHCNHAQELDDSVRPVLHELRRIDCHLLNQTVLLAGINDNAHVLADLSQTLFSFGVLPYYLHVLDKVKGAAHFDLPFNTVKGIYQQLQNLLPGYMLPRLVREEPGKSSKTLLI
ncbi:EF-P beta-lysylation protein EpmB [Legionella longbeachae]|uniref:L-lysine 2,3-aminomutase n=1 Tax=Legionella longbeachae serogroup 1 (strain NSW150) TaxID=661367 RepID=D3HPH5_LEGLN|nr:EF-P beta-lysylation protein EpmB [Legionella longbeachae]VEE01314.1 lysine aminomutase [Legionella oakridgensis]HBD7398250.1 EF-P beta-lysylation protein EpmB [Legionella pneumophila]ARB92321.1 EF-P beta-lysylation protein EpmB [Legionella longbeachae]ARM34498.1 EF-P beta-lysylation protein EpmB [Legionella longbeachae]EEZ96206.1 KamA family protein [Legionella longbeachae D-4968]